MYENNIIVLSKSSNHQIVRFKDCGHIGLMYKNLLLSFHPKGFQKFSDTFQNILFDQHAVPFPDGKNRLIMNTSFQQIQFSFTRNEFEKLKKAFQKALLMLEVTKVLNNDRMN